MSKDEFHARLRQFVHRQPFVTIGVDLNDGRCLLIRKPPVIFSDGAASFIDPQDGALVDFCCEDVHNIRLIEQETAA
ncbi:MAG: hypothetical protein HYR84_14915 [Planctomycetes bacterium]|nr:hypothetical protein [Planctomycetota bacterium]